MKYAPSIIDVARKYSSAEACVAYLEAMRWPEGVRCPVCGGKEISKFVTNETTRERKNRKGATEEVRVPARHLYTCLEPTCGHQFSPTAGTIFHDTHLPLEKWFQAVALMCNAKKGLSAKQMQRDIGVSYRTAWYLCHRIRKAMADEGGIFGGTVEMDATFVGGKYDKRRKRSRYDKAAVAGIMQRRIEDGPSRVRVFHVEGETGEVVNRIVDEHVSLDATVYTDEGRAYIRLGKVRTHDIVGHGKNEWVRGDVHTNAIEGFWSLFKRGLIGQFHQISVKHLNRYLNEFQFRFNNREAEDLFGLIMLNLVMGTALQYKALTGSEKDAAAPEPSEPF